MEDPVIRILWDRRNHQDNLIHNRVSWLIATQAFLLVAFISACHLPNSCLSEKILLSIPVTGLLSIVLVYVSIVCGIRTYKNIRERLYDVVKSSKSGWYGWYGVTDYSKTFLDRKWWRIKYVGFLPALFVPWVFIILWIFLLTVIL